MMTEAPTLGGSIASWYGTAVAELTQKNLRLLLCSLYPLPPIFIIIEPSTVAPVKLLSSLRIGPQPCQRKHGG